MLRRLLERVPGFAFLGRRFALPDKATYRILIFSWRCPVHAGAGGGEAYLFEQARHWVGAGHSVTWVAQRVAGRPNDETIDGIDILRRGHFPTVFLYAALWYVFRSNRRFDFIIDCMNGIPFFTPLFSRKPKACLLHHVHSHHFREELPFPLSAIAIALETKIVPILYRNTRFITVSASTKSEMERLRMSALPIEIVHNGVTPSLQPGAKATQPTILYLGRLRRYKRIRKLIDAFGRVRRRFPEARLVIAGTGDDEANLKTYAARTLGAGVATFHGFVDEAEKERLLREAWVFAMPSSIEGWGIAVMEAAASGTPAVVYRVPGLIDCVIENETALVADDDDEFSAALERLLADAQLRERLERRCVAWSAGFSWQVSSQRLLESIRNSQPGYRILEELTRIVDTPTTLDADDDAASALPVALSSG